MEELTVLDAQLSDARNAESDGGAVSRLQRLTPRRQRLTVVPVARVEVRNQRLVDPRVHLLVRTNLHTPTAGRQVSKRTFILSARNASVKRRWSVEEKTHLQ